MNKIKQSAFGLLLAVFLVGCSEQSVGIQQPVTEVAIVSQEKEVKEGGDVGKFQIQGWKDQTAKAGYNIVKYYVVNKAFEAVSNSVSKAWSNTDYGRASKAQADYAKAVQEFKASCQTAKYKNAKCPK